MANAYKAHDKYGGVYTVPTTTILPWYKPKRYEKPPKPESAEAATLPPPLKPYVPPVYTTKPYYTTVVPTVPYKPPTFEEVPEVVPLPYYKPPYVKPTIIPIIPYRPVPPKPEVPEKPYYHQFPKYTTTTTTT